MREKIISLTAMLFFAAVTTFAGSLPDTGQTKCYDNNAEITCPQPGESFYRQDAQYTCNPQSYTDLGNGIVRDNVTGLEWQQATAPGIYTWQQALDYCDALSLGGRDDWRLPTINELSTLVDSSIPYPGPTINTTYFPGTVASSYWSSTTFSSYTYNAWFVNFYYGNVNYNLKYNFHYARAVRGGPSGSLGNLVINGDGTITDTTTGLMWQQATAPGTYTWEQALTYCENLTLPSGGYSDWRLPNRNELQSIVDYNRYNPSIDTAVFPGTVVSYYWSSTTDAIYSGHAWSVSFSSGNVYDYFTKSVNLYVRAVRVGSCDSDRDGILDDWDSSTVVGDSPCIGGNTDNCDDNCPYMPNGPNYGTCVMTNGNIVYASNSALLEPCSDNSTCTCQMEQGDINGNGIGDVCECYADIKGDGKVNSSDLLIMKLDYNRKDCYVNPCNADCNDDGKVNSYDFLIMKSQYNRSGCPVIQ